MRRKTTVVVLMLVALALAGCRRESRETVHVISSAEVAGTGLPQKLTETFATASGARVELQILDGDSMRTWPFDGSPVVVITNDAQLVGKLRPGARLAIPFARADFVIVGPTSDPAKIKGVKTAPEAFRRIAAAQRAFCAPVDVPRLRARELAIWQAAGVDPHTDRRYRPCRGGPKRLLGDTASRFGYTIVDRGSAETAEREKRLTVLFEGTPMLQNDYTILLLVPGRRTPKNAEWFVQWVASYRGREIVDRHRIDGEKRFFAP